YDLQSLGGAAFQASAQRIHRLLFDEPAPDVAAETIAAARIA
ncbi:MAG TPA: ABC transporter ATP-binding protein, partial [Roseateles sp.]|nr:ABC transporter ATP-binding protein [Roseateles sp.]